MAKKKKVDLPRVTLAYQGRIRSKNGKLFHTYVKIGDDWESGLVAGHAPGWFGDELDDDQFERMNFTDRASHGFGYARVGDVLSIVSEDGSTVSPRTAKVVGKYPKEIALEWASLSATEETEHEAERMAKDRSKLDYVVAHCEQLNLTYRKLRGRTKRAAYLARIIEAVTKGS